jgi:hypothetical protein
MKRRKFLQNTIAATVGVAAIGIPVVKATAPPPIVVELADLEAFRMSSGMSPKMMLEIYKETGVLIYKSDETGFAGEIHPMTKKMTS